ncbi:Bug family tripartite tricarboxylate transporter substrate binding protein [Chelativorans alearense]|uniref:Bug family tripartite tricarboxylate transporter substrate binding protein n=1 Tax=Chelativorans alearense TaxID=2681495 RepID=UPI0013D3F5F3|nr:tripartite tricarboxylate transporter substrate binding protein [Chelativorans alearense]
MKSRTRLGVSLALALSALVPAVASGQDYPSKTITIYTAAAEGNADVTARLIATHADLGQPVVVVNQPSVLSAQQVAQADPDGYSLLVLGKSFYLAPIFQADTPYDPIAQFAPISKITSTPNIMVVHPDLPDTVEGVIAKAKAEPGAFNYATGASGGTAHLAAALLLDLTGIEMERVIYRGGGPSMVGVMSNESQLSFGTPAQVGPLVEAGNLKAIAVTSRNPSSVAPDLPTVAETVPGFQMTSIQGFWTTAGTPQPIIDKLNKEVERILNLPEVKDILQKIGADADHSMPQDFAAEMKEDIETTKRLMAGN